MSLLCKSKVRRFALDAAVDRKLSTGQPRFTRVSSLFLIQVEVALKQGIRDAVQRAHSKGHTL